MIKYFSPIKLAIILRSIKKYKKLEKINFKKILTNLDDNKSVVFIKTLDIHLTDEVVD